MRITITHSNEFDATGLDNKILRQQLKTYGVDARRLSRFTQIALLGALPLRAQIQPQCAIYLASPFNSPSKFDKMFYQLHQHNLPSPLDFMANINNAATFQLAQILQTTGNSIFLATQDIAQAQHLAKLDLHLGESPQALIGWVLESGQGKEEARFELLERR